MKNKPFFSYLGLAMRAGKLATGEDIVLDAVRSGKAKLVILAEDASANTRKKVQDKCGYYQVPIIEQGSRGELGSSIGKAERVMIAVTDAGFAKMIKSARHTPEVE
jgi:ribosomal protein L7Ae-like RNA K-turn-binding protein